MTDDGYPVYGANGRIGFYSEYNHEEPTVLITCRGATCGTINVCEPKSYVTGNAMALDELDINRADLRFVAYALNKRGLRDAITGSAQPQITRTSLSGVEIPLPPLSEQKRIADILDKADAIRRKRQEAIDLLPSLRSAVFHDRFGDPIANPKSWHVVELQDLFETSPNYGTMIKPSDEVRGWLDLRVANIQDGKLDLSSRKYVDLPHNMIERHEVRDGDLLLARAIGSLEHLGKCIIAHPGDQKWAFDSHLMRIRFDSTRVLPRFVHAFLQSPGGRHEFLSHSRRSAVQFNVNTKEMACIRIPLPPLEEQRCFIEELDTIDQFAIRHETASNESRALFNSLVQRAFRGNL
jgi:type I restriction enzyme S subunit